jgi:hypothetical protein
MESPTKSTVVFILDKLIESSYEAATAKIVSLQRPAADRRLVHASDATTGRELPALTFIVEDRHVAITNTATGRTIEVEISDLLPLMCAAAVCEILR